MILWDVTYSDYSSGQDLYKIYSPNHVDKSSEGFSLLDLQHDTGLIFTIKLTLLDNVCIKINFLLISIRKVGTRRSLQAVCLDRIFFFLSPYFSSLFLFIVFYST